MELREEKEDFGQVVEMVRLLERFFYYFLVQKNVSNYRLDS